MTDIDIVDQEQLFDRMADDYDLLLADWDKDLLEQGRQLDGFIRRYAPGLVQSVLDCTCGIGTQSIGLARQGYQVTGTDISGKSVARARLEASRFQVDVRFAVADLRTLDATVTDHFDCVISCDNSLPALLTEEDVRSGLRQMYTRLKPGGLSIVSIREYHQIFKEKKRFHPRQVHETETGRTVVFDLWDYPSKDIVVFNVFYLKEGPGGWDVATRKMVYRAIYPEDLVALLTETGFSDIEVVRELNGTSLPFNFYICRK
ncbi:MAG: class I SAM-dependent methyltransferase [Desulfobacterales bacterium]|nr:class I SAM-dependent methyltransferase [Desulfobacterales bacterium]